MEDDKMKKVKSGARVKIELSNKTYEKAIKKTKIEKYFLKLYVTGMTQLSMNAIANIKAICEEHLKNRYELEIINIYDKPVLSKGEQIIAAPTLIKKLPLPLRRFIGDLSNTEKVLLGLDLRKEK